MKDTRLYKTLHRRRQLAMLSGSLMTVGMIGFLVVLLSLSGCMDETPKQRYVGAEYSPTDDFDGAVADMLDWHERRMAFFDRHIEEL